MTTTKRARALAAAAAALAAALFDGPAEAVAGPWIETPHSKARLVSRWATAPPGGDAGLGLEFALAPGWHVYWKNSGDAGFAPRFALAPGAGLDGAVLRFPAPARFELPGDLVSFGYEGTVVYPLDARVAADAPPRLALGGRLDYLVCAGECIPYRADLALELPVGDAVEDPARAAAIDAWRSRLPRPVDGHRPPIGVTARSAKRDYPWSLLDLAFSAPGLGAAAPDLFFAPQDRVELGRPEFVAAAPGPSFRVRFRQLDETKPLPADFAVEWTATGLELDGVPLALEGTALLAPGAPARAPRRISLPLVAAAGLLIGALAALLRRRFQQIRSGVQP
jgi:DsbC/DsbD-like thiol-disulfide interchange protein